MAKLTGKEDAVTAGGTGDARFQHRRTCSGMGMNHWVSSHASRWSTASEGAASGAIGLSIQCETHGGRASLSPTPLSDIILAKEETLWWWKRRVEGPTAYGHTSVLPSRPTLSLSGPSVA